MAISVDFFINSSNGTPETRIHWTLQILKKFKINVSNNVNYLKYVC